MAATDRAAANLPIQRLKPENAEGVWPLSVEAGWNQVVADWRLMIGTGTAFGIQSPQGAWIASALALPLGPSISWISMVLVTAPERGKGHGTRLLRRCITEIEQGGGAMGLDATEFGRPIYLPLGFRDVYPLSRWSAAAGVRTPVSAPAGITLRPAETADLARVAAYDCPRSGLDRAPILRELLQRTPNCAHLATRQDGTIVGYGLGRDGRRATHIGPVVADDEAIGLALASRAMGQLPGPVIMDVPDQHERLRGWLSAQGATAPRSFMRMLRGPAHGVEDGRSVFALAGPELA